MERLKNQAAILTILALRFLLHIKVEMLGKQSDKSRARRRGLGLRFKFGDHLYIDA